MQINDKNHKISINCDIKNQKHTIKNNISSYNKYINTIRCSYNFIKTT